MNPMKLKLIEELLSHLSDSQGSDLKSMLDESKKPMMEEDEESEGLPHEMAEAKPKGLKIESIEVMKKPKRFDDQANEAIAEISKKPEMPMEEEASSLPGEEEMSDDELSELLKKYLS